MVMARRDGQLWIPPSFDQIQRADVLSNLRTALNTRAGSDSPGGLPLLAKIIVPTVDLTASILGTIDVGQALADALTNPSVGFSGVFPHLFNATTWDRQRGNLDITVFASAARTATVRSATQTNYNNRGVVLVLDVTAASGTSPTLDNEIDWSAPVPSGTWFALGRTSLFIQWAQMTSTGIREVSTYPGQQEVATPGNDRAYSFVLPRTWSILATIGGTTPSFTFSIAGSKVV